MRDYVVRLFYTTMAGESAFIRETGIIKAPNGMSAANKAIKKYAYDDILDKKKKRNDKIKQKFNLESINTSTKQNKHISEKNVHNYLSNEYNTTENNSSTFTNFFHNFIDNEIKKSKNESMDNSVELAKKIQKMEIIKKNLSMQNQG